MGIHRNAPFGLLDGNKKAATLSRNGYSQLLYRNYYITHVFTSKIYAFCGIFSPCDIP
jgi:hypothetical protein